MHRPAGQRREAAAQRRGRRAMIVPERVEHRPARLQRDPGGAGRLPALVQLDLPAPIYSRRAVDEAKRRPLFPQCFGRDDLAADGAIGVPVAVPHCDRLGVCRQLLLAHPRVDRRDLARRNGRPAAPGEQQRQGEQPLRQTRASSRAWMRAIGTTSLSAMKVGVTSPSPASRKV